MWWSTWRSVLWVPELQSNDGRPSWESAREAKSLGQWEQSSGSRQTMHSMGIHHPKDLRRFNIWAAHQLFFKNSSCSREIKLRKPSNSSLHLCKREKECFLLPLLVPQHQCPVPRHRQNEVGAQTSQQSPGLVLTPMVLWDTRGRIHRMKNKLFSETVQTRLLRSRCVSLCTL